jgi:hypothetical protein
MGQLQSCLSAMALVALLAGHVSTAQALTVEGGERDSLELYCRKIPQRQDQLCFVTTNSPVAPAEDVIFYKREPDGSVAFLEAERGDTAVIFVAGFSTGGRYTVIGRAEEGHPGFYVYVTEQFLDPTIEHRVVASVNEYELSELVSLSDDGTAIARLYPCEEDVVPNARQVPLAAFDRKPLDDECYVMFNIFDAGED